MRQAIGAGRPDEFARLHRLFVEHFGFAVAFAWAAALAAALRAPWLTNIRGLIDPVGRTESTASFLFGLPVLMALGWLVMKLYPEAIRRAQMLKNQHVEFAVAGAAALGVFCLAIDRAVTAFLLGV